MIEFVIGLLALIDAVVTWALPWRYLTSSEFRERVHARWRTKTRAFVAVELIVFTIFFVAITAGVVALVWRTYGLK